MRDPARIPKIIAKLQRLWEQQPDIRLCQLIMNVTAVSESQLFYVEDDKLERFIEEEMAQ